MGRWIAAAMAVSALAPAAASGDTITYTYDAKGRLIKVVRSTGPTTTYTLDKADNRTRVLTTGSGNAPPP